MLETIHCPSEEDDAGVREISFVSFGVSVSILLPISVPLQELELFLPPGREPFPHSNVDRAYALRCLNRQKSGSGPGYRLFLGERFLADSTDLNEVLSALESDLSIAIATDPRHGLVFVHAGVVAIGNRALVFPGESRSGKSTLLRALVERGASYFSDEFAVFDKNGNVHPYARDPSFRGQNRWAIGRKVSVTTLGGDVGSAAIPVGGILGCRFLAESSWNCPEVGPARGAMLLLENGVAAQLYPETTFRTLSRVAEGCKVREGTRGEAQESVEEILRCFWGFPAPLK